MFNTIAKRNLLTRVRKTCKFDLLIRSMLINCFIPNLNFSAQTSTYEVPVYQLGTKLFIIISFDIMHFSCLLVLSFIPLQGFILTEAFESQTGWVSAYHNTAQGAKFWDV